LKTNQCACWISLTSGLQVHEQDAGRESHPCELGLLAELGHVHVGHGADPLRQRR
jgi:hypothetical protein